VSPHLTRTSSAATVSFPPVVCSLLNSRVCSGF